MRVANRRRARHAAFNSGERRVYKPRDVKGRSPDAAARWLALGALASVLAACATTAPRFSQPVATTFAHEPMRVVVTPELEVYFPEHLREQALRVAARAAECVRELRARQKTTRPRDRALLFITSANFNNAYVTGLAYGEPLHSLVPTQLSSESFAFDGLPDVDPGDVACHEMAHFVHFEQVENFWRAVNAVFGPVAPPEEALGSWFNEGLAQYYEGRLYRKVGRPHSAWYRGVFESFVASRGGALGPGDLSPYNRELYPESGAYLSGLFFVEWLAQRSGEERLWELMDLQGRSFFWPFGTVLRFKTIYGASLGALVDEWSESLQAGLVVRERPEAQRVLLPHLGQWARLASHATSGTLAVVTSGNDEVPMLRILGPEGGVRVERRLTRMFPWREWVVVGPSAASGLSFTADGQWLFLMNGDVTARGDTTGQLWKIDVLTGDVVQVWQGLGPSRGGCASADGARYTLVRTGPGFTRLVERDLASGDERVLVELPAETPASSPQWSPDGERLVFSRLDSVGWNLVVREPDGSLRSLTRDGAASYGARFDAAGRVVFGRAAGRTVQVHRLALDGAELERLSDVPYGLADPAPVPGGVAVVNRDGTQWSLDVVPAQPLEVTAVADEQEPPPRHEPPPLQIESDEPYSGFDHVFVPQMRFPSATLGFVTDAAGGLHPRATVYASLSGRDRLSWHNWGAEVGLIVPSLESTVWVGYRNLQLAPWSVAVAGSRLGLIGDTYWAASASAGRTIFTAPLSFGVYALVHEAPLRAADRFIGPWAEVAYASSESTAYGGPQRLLAVSLRGAAYPTFLGSSFTLLDGRAGLALAAPLPLSTRHNLVLTAVGRALYGAPRGSLRVGGVQLPGTVWWNPDGSGPPASQLVLPGSLVEGLRGYEDRAVLATRAALATLQYQYSFVIDRGLASVLYLLPSLFFRQVDVQLFGSAALTDSAEGPWARAVGGAVLLRAVLGDAISLALYYQLSYRFDLGLPPLHAAGLAVQ